MAETKPTIDRLAAYREAGVDLDVSNVASQIANNWSRQTWSNRAGSFGEPSGPDADFSADKWLELDDLRRRPDVVLSCEVDGTGTKPEFYERRGEFRGLGKDLVAMAADDHPVKGGESILINNQLTLSRLSEADLPLVDELFEGLAAGAHEAELVLFTGEIAVHGDRLSGPTPFSVDFVGDAIGLKHRSRMITGQKIREGDELWGLGQPEGFRCNGITLVRKQFERAYGTQWHTVPFGDSSLGEAVGAPATIYSGLMNRLTGGYRIEQQPKISVHGAAHISGGSVPEKVGRMLRVSGLGAEIDDPFEPPAIMLHAQDVAEVSVDGSTYATRPMSDEELITTWHGGQGYILAIDGHDGDTLRWEAEARGITAKRIGQVSKQVGIRILSRGKQTPGKILEFLPGK